MVESKSRMGMSQTLALIVAASVLMMTALTVIFMVQGGLGDVNQGTSQNSCQGAIETICTGTNGEINTPASCTADGQLIPGMNPPPAGVGPDTVDCQAYNSR